MSALTEIRDILLAAYAQGEDAEQGAEATTTPSKPREKTEKKRSRRRPAPKHKGAQGA